MRIRLSLLSIALLSGLTTVDAATNLLRLELGDPERSERSVALTLDAITDSRTGESLAPDDLPGRLAGVRLLFVGESHTSVEFHRAQLRVIEALHRAGRRVKIGLEMYPYTDQSFLDGWSAGHFTEQGFLDRSHWYDAWGYHWDYYRDIFLFAREHGLPMIGINTPREVVTAVRKKGFDELTEEERARIPATIDTDNDDHFRLFKAYFDDDDNGFHSSMTEEQWRSMFDAQCTWDATMGHNAARALGGDDDPRTIVVVLIGAAHLAYDLGVQRQVAGTYEGRMATIIPIDVGGPCDEPVEEVQASYADFVWGLPHEPYAKYPTLGMSTGESDEAGRRKVIHVPEDTPAAGAGFVVGDVLLSLDGVDLPDRESLNREMARKSWGDRATFEVRRGDETLTLIAELRRSRPEPCDED